MVKIRVYVTEMLNIVKIIMVFQNSLPPTTLAAEYGNGMPISKTSVEK